MPEYVNGQAVSSSPLSFGIDSDQFKKIFFTRDRHRPVYHHINSHFATNHSTTPRIHGLVKGPVRLREQIIGMRVRSSLTQHRTSSKASSTDNIEVAFPSFYKGYNSVADIKFKIIVYSPVSHGKKGRDYYADVLWGPSKQTFLKGEAGETPYKALENLLDTSASVLYDLMVGGKLEKIETVEQEVIGGGTIVCEAIENKRG